MYRPRSLTDKEISALLERAGHDPAARRDLAAYLHHSERVSTVAPGEAPPDMSAKYIDEFRAKYRLA
jgi:hypothetical protein